MSLKERDVSVSISTSNLLAHMEELLRRYKYLNDNEDLVEFSVGTGDKGFIIPRLNTTEEKTFILRYKSAREEVEVVRPW